MEKEITFSDNPQRCQKWEKELSDIFPWNKTCVSEGQPPKALFQITPTLSGITTDFNDEQPLNAYSLIVVTLSGITTDSNDEQPLNAQEPILVTPSGITTDVNNEQFINARFSIAVTGRPPNVAGMTIAPTVSSGIAHLDWPPTTTPPLEGWNDHSIPFTTSFCAKSGKAVVTKTNAMRFFISDSFPKAVRTNAYTSCSKNVNGAPNRPDKSCFPRHLNGTIL